MKKWYALVSGIMVICLILATACVPTKDSGNLTSGSESSESTDNNSSDTNKEDGKNESSSSVDNGGAGENGENSSSENENNNSSEGNTSSGNTSSGNTSSGGNSGTSGNKFPNVIGTTTPSEDEDKEENKDENLPENETTPPNKEEGTTGPDTEAGEEEEELLENQIKASDYPFNLASLSGNLEINVARNIAFKASLLSCDGTKLVITQGHKTSSATVALDLVDFESSGSSAVYVKVDATEQTGTSLVKFLLKSEKVSQLKLGGVYYLIDTEGRIFKYNHSSNRSCSIPAGFSGYVVLPLSEYVYLNSETAINTNAVNQIQIQFESVEKDAAKKMTFSEFKCAYLLDSSDEEVYNTAYVSRSEISSSNYPYLSSTSVVVDTLDVNDRVTTLGGYSTAEGRTYEGRVRLRQSHSNNNCGVSLGLKYSSAGYTAVYIEVDNTENGDSWLKFLSNTSTGYAEMKKGATAYLISKYGQYYSYKNTNDTTAICIPEGFKGNVVIPFDSFCYVSNGNSISQNDVTGLTVLLKSVTVDASKSIYLDNYGYIVGSLASGQIVESDYELSGLESVLINDLDDGNVNLGSWNGITSDYYELENGRLKITCGHTSSSATVAVTYGGDPSKKKGLSFDVDATEMEGASYLTLLLYTSQGYSWIVDGGYYYLYEDGVYYRHTHGSYHSVMIPKGFKGKVILPFVQYVYNGTQSRIDPSTLSGSMYIQLQNVAKDPTKNLYFDNFTYICDKESPSGELITVPMGGGGYVTGVYIHPLDNNIKYIRTDVGGAYKWDVDRNEWTQMLSFGSSQSQLYAVDGLALDPNDVNVIYAGLGNGGGTPVQDRGIYKSTDQGKTWEKLVHVNFFGNGTHRQNGECIMVDPNNSNVIYAGTRLNGLYYSRDGGNTWTQVSSGQIPFNSSGNIGIRAVAIDPTSTVDGRSKTVYAGGHGVGVYRSTDGGTNWSKISSLPNTVQSIRVASDGTLLATSDEGLFKYKNETATNISPTSHTYYLGLDVDPTNPNRIVTCYSIDGGAGPMGLPIFLSEDGGVTWRNLIENGRKIDRRGWWESYYFSSATACLKFNPHNTKELWFTDWYGVWVTYDVNETKTDWYSKVIGHEEAVITDKISLPEGPIRFIAGTYDNGSLFYKDVTVPPTHRILGDTPDIVYSYSNPNFVVYGSVGSTIYISTNYGETTTAVSSGVANSMDVAVSATNTDNIVVGGWSTVPYYTKDGGATWNASTGAPANSMTTKWTKQDNLVSDGANGDIFYYSASGGIYRSNNGGESYTLVNTTLTDFTHIQTVRGKEGWVYALSGGTVYVSHDYGNTFTALTSVTGVKSISFGKGKTVNELAFYAIGEYNGEKGLFISDDYGETFELMIESDKMRCFGGVLGDMQIYGACYMTSGGEGAVIVYK